ncbi:MAG TPA: hypothetical protein PKD17_04585 [Cellvibrionaceae bacterium]|nr:hypothetical protein [Cellvibrionaceae bacterium]HMW71070.1 hypothetical protein [Cellvibrionaceae bacterium]HMY37867.1 hypothetical protein [Marinagarivorans sp.]HNG58942.1 hypothetical protein [Cellvibrionaceae bacterium]
MSENTITVDWSECIVLFNSLLRNIEQLREIVDADGIDDDELYEAEEELNDYVILLAHLKNRYSNLADKGELSPGLKKRLAAVS